MNKKTHDLSLPELPLRIEVDVRRFRSNILRIKDHVANHTGVILVAKSSMYNLGSEIIDHCHDLIDGIAVDNLATAINYAEQGFKKNIYILCPLTPLWFEKVHHLEKHSNLIPCLDSLATAKALIPLCKNNINVAVKINMGLNRFGILPNELKSMMEIIENTPIRVKSIYSHFAGTTGRPLAELKKKETSFLQLVDPYRDRGIRVHISDSGCTVRNIGTNLDFVRVGLLPIGIDPVEVEHTAIAGLELGFKVCSTVLKVTHIKKGGELGYRDISASDRTIATIAGGYGHGLPRDAAMKGYAIINGVPCPYVCKSFMEYSIIDISDCEFPVNVGDEVMIIDDNCNPTALANTSDNIPEVFFTALSQSIKRVFID